MIRSLVDMFTAISDIEVIPDDWHSGIIRPLHKSGSLYDIDNYRGTTLSSNVYKIFSKTIESTAVNHLESNNILGELQGAFRKVRRLEDHIFTQNGICSLAKSSKKPLYIAFLDLSKAFNGDWREGLLAKVCESGIQGKPWRLIKDIYRNVQKKDLFKDYESDYFDQEYRVKQGCVLYPTLFTVLMNDVVQMLSDKTISVNISLNLTNCLLFADDVVLMADSPRELQTLLQISHGDFNRLNFGDALWNSVIRPSLTHACAVWMPLSQASKDSLDSWQYKAAKIIIRTKLNIPKAAILLELGWEPLSVFIDRQRISYYKRLLRLPNLRLCISRYITK